MTRGFRRWTLVGFLVVLLCVAGKTAQATPIVPGFNSSTLAANDDGSTGLINLGFSFNYFGTTYTQTYVNNNGNITFTTPLSTYTPFGLTTNTGTPIIAAFFGDVDTRGAGSGLVTYGTGTFTGNGATSAPTFGVNWPSVGYYGFHTDLLNSFQLLLVSRSDLTAGDADIYFNYGSIQWETGDASGGSGGFGGECAHAGYTNGSGAPGTNFEIPGSGICGAFLNGGANQLVTSTNDNVPGQWLFEVRNGEIIQPTTSPGVITPEPASLLLLGSGLSAVAMRLRKKNRKG